MNLPDAIMQAETRKSDSLVVADYRVDNPLAARLSDLRQSDFKFMRDTVCGLYSQHQHE
jgi:hypothetical protein